MLKQVLSAVAKKETKSGKYGTTGSYLNMTFSINGSRLYLYDMRIPGAAGMGLDINSTWRQVISIEYQPPTHWWLNITLMLSQAVPWQWEFKVHYR